jgi:single-strand selective monofunctional uracil DNA glycosylase
VDAIAISRALCAEVEPLRFSAPTSFVYNPLVYARAPAEAFLRRFAASKKEAVFLGMNPGPWGMAQTGVPFGEVAAVRDWMGIDEPVLRPEREHPKRPIQGLDCARSEVSGRRVWGWAAERFGTPEAFFERFCVLNYCPLCFMEESGRNRTPDKLPADERTPLFEACDRALRRTVELLQPELVIGVGAFAEKRAKGVLAGMDVRIGRILHPSPASPAANRGWAPQAEAQLRALGVTIEGS